MKAGVASTKYSNGATGNGSGQSVSDGNPPSRIIIGGIEDLGGGLLAGICPGCIPDIRTNMIDDNGLVPTGTSSPSVRRLFNRRSTLGLRGGFGTFRLGKSTPTTAWDHTVFDPFGTTGAAGSQAGLLGYGEQRRRCHRATPCARSTTRSATTCPRWGWPVWPSVSVRPSPAPKAPIGAEYGVRRANLAYAAGPVNVAAAYAETKLPNTNLKAANIGASFNMGFMTLMGQYHDVPASTARQQADQQRDGRSRYRDLQAGRRYSSVQLRPDRIGLKVDLPSGWQAEAPR